MTHRGPFQPLLFCDSVIPARNQMGRASETGPWPSRGRAAAQPGAGLAPALSDPGVCGG